MSTQSILLITLIYLIGVTLSMFAFYMHNRINNKDKARIEKYSLFEASMLSIFSFFMVIAFLLAKITHKMHKYIQKKTDGNLSYKKLNKKFISEED